MSGVGVTGLIANLPGTITPYPTQDPNLELGGCRQVANAAARDAIPANFRALDMLVTLQDTGVTYQLYGGLTNADWKVYTGAAFKGLYFIDPGFTGPQLGSESNPFTTYAAALAFAAALGVTSGSLRQAPGTNVVENITLPTTGDWEIAGVMGYGLFVTIITGNITVSSTASARRTLTSIRVTGNVSGNCSAGTLRVLYQNGVAVDGTTTLTVTGAGIARLGSGSPVQEFSGQGYLQNFLTGAVSIQGTFAGSNAIFGTSLAFSATSSFVDCLMPPTTTVNTAGGVSVYMQSCANAVGGGLTLNVVGGGFIQLQCDGTTLEEFSRVGLTTSGTVNMQSFMGGRSSTSTQVTNVGVTPIIGKLPPGLMVVDACLTLLTNAGATAGNATLNVVYTDATGTLVTEAVTTALNVAGVIGSKARGTFQISQNGATAVSWSVTGITNATSLTYKCDVAVRQAS